MIAKLLSELAHVLMRASVTLDPEKVYWEYQSSNGALGLGVNEYVVVKVHRKRWTDSTTVTEPRFDAVIIERIET